MSAAMQATSWPYCASVYGVASAPSSSIPTEKSLQPLRAPYCDFPACQARSPKGTYWLICPSRRMTRWAEAFRPSICLKYGCSSRGSVPVNRRSIHGPPNSFGGRLMPCTTISSGSVFAGRASKCGESTCRTPVMRPVAVSTLKAAGEADIADLGVDPAVSGADHDTIARMTSANAAYIRRDLAHVWHPCTQMKDHEAEIPLIPIRRGQGVWLEDFEGRRYLDAVSSWWVNLFGHAHPRINAAVRAQLDSLEQVMLAGFTHEPVIALSEELTAVAPAGLNRCFYADNGSSAVEVAVKMSFHYWRNSGHPAKRRFITLSNSYHGETLGALAVGNVDLYKDIYRPLLMDVITVPSPDCYLRTPGAGWAEHSRAQFAHMEAALAAHAHEACAVIVEPLVQCAAGMRMYDPVYLALLREACDRHRVHLIADEIAVGFGRTGTLFACEQAGIRPDFMCLSKGLTAGYLPLSVVLTTDEVYAAFYDDYVKQNAFLHSHSFTGNPLACAAARACLKLLREDDVLARNRALAAHLGARARALQEHPHVAEVRQCGMIAAVELVREKASNTPYPWQERRGLRVYRHALSRGVLLRPIGNVVYFMPPYVVTPAQIDLMVEVAREGIGLATCA